VKANQRTLCISALFGALCAATAAAQVEVDSRLPVYEPVQGVSGNVSTVGSDTMNNLVKRWGESFRKHYPNVQIEIEGKGSSTAPAALIAGTATFGPMSRAMKSKEIDEFKAKFGYAPTGLRTAIDMLAVYVHKDNPLAGLSLQQVDAIFSATRKGGGASAIRTWGDLGLEGEWASKPISLYGRNSASGTYGYFKEHALFGGDFSDSVKEQPGSSSVVQGVASDKYGIGYSGIGYKTADVRAVSLAREGTSFVEAVPENAYAGEYPLARPLLLYVNYRPDSRLDPLQREFVRFIFSREGQNDVIQDGYYPVPATIAAADMKKAGLEIQLVEAGAGN